MRQGAERGQSWIRDLVRLTSHSTTSIGERHKKRWEAQLAISVRVVSKVLDGNVDGNADASLGILAVGERNETWF